MSKKIIQNKPPMSAADIAYAKTKAKFKHLYENSYGPTDTVGIKAQNFKAMGFEKASKEYKSWNPWGENRKAWNPLVYSNDNYAIQAFEQQTFSELASSTLTNFGMRAAAGFMGSIGSWDVVDMTNMAMGKADVEYGNWFTQIADKINEHVDEHHKIYMDPTGSIWNGAYFANSIGQLGYTAGIIAEMAAEQALLALATGGSGNAGTVGTLGARLTNLGMKFGSGLVQGLREAHMNALETQHSTYQNLISLRNGNGRRLYTDAEALEKSRKAANEHFKAEGLLIAGVNALQNTLFFGRALKGLDRADVAFNKAGSGMTFGVSDMFQSVGEKLASGLSSKAQKRIGWGLMMGSEGIEEMVQTGIGIYAQNKALGKESTIEDFNTREVWESGFHGALGGGMFGVAMKKIEHYQNKSFNERYKAFFDESLDRTREYTRKEKDAHAIYAKAIQELDKDPNNKELRKKAAEAETNFLRARNASTLGEIRESLIFDHAKGEGTIAFNMQIEKMKQMEEAAKNKDIDALKGFGIIDENGKEIYKGAIQFLAENTQNQIAKAEQYKNSFARALENKTDDVGIAMAIADEETYMQELEKSRNNYNTEFNKFLSGDLLFNRLSLEGQKRFKLEAERDSYRNHENLTPEMEKRLEEIQEELDNLPNYNSEDLSFVDSIDRNPFINGFTTSTAFNQAIKDSANEIAKLNNPEHIKEIKKKQQEEAIAQAKSMAEAKKAEKKAEESGDETLINKAKNKVKDLKKKFQASEDSQVDLDSKKDIIEEDIEDTSPNYQSKKEDIGVGKDSEKKKDFMSMFSSGSRSIDEESLDEVEKTTEHFARPNIDAREESNKKFNDAAEEVRKELSEELGREATYEDFIKEMIRLGGKEKIKDNLESIKKAFEANGHKTSDVSHLFSKKEGFLNLLDEIRQEESITNEEVVKNNTPTKTDSLLEVEQVQKLEQHGVGVGINKLATYNSRVNNKYTSRDNEVLGHPTDNTLRYTAQKGDKYIMAVVENPLNTPIAVYDRRNPNDIKKLTTMTFGEFLDWVTSGKAEKYGYPKIEKNSPEYKELYQEKVPMVYMQYNEATGEVGEIVAYVHDVEWYNLGTVSKLAENPYEIISQGRNAVKEERKAFFEKGQKIAEVKNLDILGSEMFLSEINPTTGKLESNMVDGTLFVTLEEGTGNTRIGIVEEGVRIDPLTKIETKGNFKTIKLQDGTVINPSETLPGTSIPRYIGTSILDDIRIGTTIEARFIKYINGEPIYKIYVVKTQTANINKPEFEQVSDVTYNTVKGLYLAKIWEMSSPEVREMLANKFGIDQTKVNEISRQFANGNLKEAYLENLLKPFIRTADNINTKNKNYFQPVAKKDYLNLYDPKSNKIYYVNFTQEGRHAVSTLEEIQNFVENLFEGDNPAMKNVMSNVDKKSMLSNKELKIINNKNEVVTFEGKHGENTYAGYIKSIVKTNVQSFKSEQIDPNTGKNIWITDISPKVQVSSQNVLQLNGKVGEKGFTNNTSKKSNGRKSIKEESSRDLENIERPESEKQISQELREKYGLREQNFNKAGFRNEEGLTMQEYVGVEVIRELDGDEVAEVMKSQYIQAAKNEFPDEDFGARPNIDNVSSDDISTNNIKGVSDKELNEVGSFLFHSTLSTIELSENNSVKPRVIWDRLNASLDKFLKPEIEALEKRVEALETAGLKDLANLKRKELDKLQAIYNNKESLILELKTQLSNLLQVEIQGDAKTMGIVDEDGNTIADPFSNDYEYEEHLEADFSKMSTEKDLKLSYSTALKITFAGIKARNKANQPVVTSLGFTSFESIDTVSEVLKTILLNTKPNTEAMLNQIELVGKETAGSNYTLSNISNALYNRLKNSPEHVKNEIIYKLSQRKLSMEKVIYSKDSKGNTMLKVQNTNSNSEDNKLRENWKNAFLLSEFVTFNKDGVKILDKVYMKNFLERLQTIKKEYTGSKEFKKQVLQLYRDMGINISNNTFEQLVNVDFGKNSFLGVVEKSLTDLLNKDGELVLEDDQNFFLDNNANSYMKELRFKELVLNSMFSSGTQREGGKNFPSSTYKIMLDDIIDELYDSNSEKFKALQEFAYSRENMLLDLIKNTSFRNQIKEFYTRVSPESIKEQGKKVFGDNSIDKTSEADNILTQLGFFQHTLKEALDVTNSKYENYAGISFRLGKMFTPALSDKGQMIALTSVLADLKDNNFIFNGNNIDVTDEVYDLMLEHLFYPELRRIADAYSRNINIKNYTQASKFFNMIPAFNNMDRNGVPFWSILEEIGKSENRKEAFENIINNEEIKNQARETLRKVIQSEVNKKIELDEKGNLKDGSWVKSGFITSVENKSTGTYSTQLEHMDTKYLNSKTKRVLTGVQKGKMVALDFIVNQFISNSNFYQLYIGDLALYSPSSKKYFTNNELDAFSLSKATGDSVTKRVAALIAPGNVLANSSFVTGESKKYRQIFINDTVTSSSIFREYISMMNNGKVSQENEKWLKMLNSEDSKERATARKELSKLNPDLAGYLEMDSTDAQEYTTWKEHLDILQGQGRITLQDKERISKAIEEDNLTKEDLKIIMNPLKPVYAGTIIDKENGLNRFVYVKSSSFPLLPQLTKGLKLDKIRVAMEHMQNKTGQNVRMSYQTANKVGAIDTSLNTEDIYNSEDIEQLFVNKLLPSSLELNRSSFKIQQDTPYKAKKYMEKGSDTYSSMGSQIWKMLMGSGVKEMGAIFPNIFPENVLKQLNIVPDEKGMITGEDLDKIKFNAEKDYFELQEQSLIEELGLDKDKSYFDLNNEEKKRVFKKLIDMLVKQIESGAYDKNILKELEIDETGLRTKIPLWTTANADKFEAIFLSVVKNRFISLKLPGNAHIVGTSEGFEKVETFENLDKNTKSGIIWLDPNHSGDLKATYISRENGEKVLKESQVLIQSHFLTHKYNEATGKMEAHKIDLREYTKVENGVLILDENKLKIHPEILQNFSFRIPSSAHQSGAILRVVGFLPENSGDLMIVPDEHTKQIGEDFDIDKRYVYKSNYKFNPTEGTITKITMSDVEELEALVNDLELSESYTDTNALIGSMFNENLNDYLGEIQSELENLTGKALDDILNNKKKLKEKIKNIIKKKALENTMIDTYKSVFSSPSEEMQQKIFRVLSMDVAEEAADLIDSASKSIDKENYTFLSDEVQRNQLKSGSTGKLGTAMHSNAVASQALMERLKEEDKLAIYTEDIDTGSFIPKSITIGTITDSNGEVIPYTSDGILGKITTIDGLRDIAAVHSENQNSAVDNVKALIMSKRNENNYTMPVLIQMTFRGFDQVDLFRVELKDGSIKLFKNEGDMLDFELKNKDVVKKSGTKIHLPSIFLAQPILKRYVELMEKSKSITTVFQGNIKDVILEQLYKEFPTPKSFSTINDKDLTGYNLFENILGNVDNNVQRKVLETFLSLEEEAEQFSKVQKLISLNSSGLGKSYFDVLQRIELLDEITSSDIKNAYKLIGDYISIEHPLFLENPQKYIEDGYVVLGSNAWKPTTSEGLMLINSLKNSIKIMEINYPYNNPSIKKIIDTIIENKGKELTLHNSAEFKWEVMNALKDAANSLDSTGLFEGDIDAERKRLFFGETKIVEDIRDDYNIEIIENTYVKGVIINGQAPYEGNGTLIVIRDSNGNIIKKLPKKEGVKELFKKGSFSSRILGGTIKPVKEGAYIFTEKKVVKTKESLGDFLHNIKNKRAENGSLLYPIVESNKFLKDLSVRLNTKEKNNITIIQNNNSKSVDFNIISKHDAFLQLLQDDSTNLGEWNGEKMTPRKLAQDLASYAFLANQEGGAIGFRSYIDVQYLNLLDYTGNIRNIYNNLLKDEITQDTFITQFYQHNPEHAFILDKVDTSSDSIVVDPEITEKQFVAIRDFNVDYSTKAYRLFKKVGETPSYVEIPVLGTFGYNEYNINNPMQVSSIEEGRKRFPKLTEFNESKVEEKVPYTIEQLFDTTSIENLVQGIINNTNNTKIKGVLENLIPYLDTNTKISLEEIETSSGRPLEGSYSANTNTIKISSTVVERALKAGKTIEEITKFMEEVITEEVLHSIQIRELSKYGTITNSYEFIPNSDAPLFITKLVALYEQAREALPYNSKTQENYESKNIFEFMAGVFEHREEYREKLDSIVDSKGKSLLQKVIEHFGKIFEYIVGKKYSEASKEVVIEMLNASRNRNTNTTISYSEDSNIFEKTSNRPNIENLIESSKVNRFLKEDILFRDISNITNNSLLSADNLISLLEKEGLITKECK